MLVRTADGIEGIVGKGKLLEKTLAYKSPAEQMADTLARAEKYKQTNTTSS